MVSFNVPTDQFQREVAVAKNNTSVALTSAVFQGFDSGLREDIFDTWCVRVSAPLYYLSTIKAEIPFICRCLKDKYTAHLTAFFFFFLQQ